MSAPFAIFSLFLLFLLASEIAVSYRRNRRAIENMRSIEHMQAQRLLPAFELLAELATMPSEREDEDAA